MTTGARATLRPRLAAAVIVLTRVAIERRAEEPGTTPP
jgi:hypothetical protein